MPTSQGPRRPLFQPLECGPTFLFCPPLSGRRGRPAPTVVAAGFLVCGGRRLAANFITRSWWPWSTVVGDGRRVVDPEHLVWGRLRGGVPKIQVSNFPRNVYTYKLQATDVYEDSTLAKD